MAAATIPLTVFTKPWRQAAIEELAQLVKQLGFDGVELAVRPGYQVEPETAHDGLLRAVEAFGCRGLRIESVASELSGRMVAACARAGIPLLRTMLAIDPAKGYRESVRLFQEHCRALEEALDGTEVRVGVQNHCGNFVGTACGLMEALEPLSEHFVAVLDFAHTALAGEPAAYALEICGPRLGLVNLKNAAWVKDDKSGGWQRRWVGATEGLTSWAEVARLLKHSAYRGAVCLTAEYSDDWGRPLSEDEVLPLIRADLNHARTLLQNV